MAKIKLEGFKCERCQHERIPRQKGKMPKVCPKCKSPYLDWDTPKQNE